MAFIGLALGTLLLLSMASLASSCNEQEKASLLQFLTGLSQDNGLTALWKNDIDCCKWEGVSCSGDGAVVEVSLAFRGLQGCISPSLGDLSNLQSLNLSCNSFTGSLPSELLTSSSIVVLDVSFNQLSRVLQPQESNSSVTNNRPLQVLNISNNLFTGEFPSAVWEKTSSLVVLNASNNQFRGLIPSSFCISSLSFAVLDLTHNKFNGSIPTGLGKCSALRVLKAGYNSLSGPLPDELFNASSLEYLSFPSNGLHGVIDGARIINLKNLCHLDLGNNMLIGKIPDSIGQLKRLQELRLSRNNMSGELPSALSNCTDLVTVNLKMNKFSGELNKFNFSNLINLKILDLLGNNFTGTISESIYSCSNLTALRLSANNLHGQLSPRIGELKSLAFLSLSVNNFTNITNALRILNNSSTLTTLIIGNNFKGEAMPEDETIAGFQNLQFLSISNCSLSGKIPLWLSKLKKLQVLLLNMNHLSGSIPAWIKNLESLITLDISDNRLTGGIPAALMDMKMLKSNMTATHVDTSLFELPVYIASSLQYRTLTTIPKMLFLGNNKLTGTIPKEIGHLKSLAELNLSFNYLSGEIPQQLCSLKNLQVLDLSSNYLTGEIPLALNELSFLAKFNISNNDLEGVIPTGGQFDTFPNSSFEGNPKLRAIMVNDSSAVPSLSMEQADRRITFVISFCAFFGVGFLYDQLVLSKFYG
ncbi:hypothetical protein SEVIR_1G080900v4 [Setaria viridis]|uniref:receptor-like protein 2 n=1 Tax=Setaria viridis TaxID=4556 RepID=UPI001493CC9A|nr:receptor-like protein 3 [Setaria viridis]XP_034585634.1 receptor-like protein 3 [Setaria viridis]